MRTSLFVAAMGATFFVGCGSDSNSTNGSPGPTSAGGTKAVGGAKSGGSSSTAGGSTAQGTTSTPKGGSSNGGASAVNASGGAELGGASATSAGGSLSSSSKVTAGGRTAVQSTAAGGQISSGGKSSVAGAGPKAGSTAAGGTSTVQAGASPGGSEPGGATNTGGASVGRAGATSSGGQAQAGGSSTTNGGAGVAGANAGGAGGVGDAVPSPGCGKTRTLKDGNQTIQSGGQSRTYYLKTPSKYDSAHAYRMIFMFHWNYGSINAIVNPPDSDHNTDLPFYGLGDLAGDSTIFVVPQGLTDTGGAGWANPNNRDVNFTDDMLSAISADLCVDTSRVFTTGFSYGGAISYKLACVRTDKFRAALVYDTGPVSGNNTAECTKPIAFFQSHGTDDQTFNYTQVGLPILSTFAKVNGCNALTPPTPPQNGHTCTSLEGCSAGHPVRFCNFGSGENNPHNTSLKGHYPSAKDPGQSVSWVPAEAWEFIKQF